MKTVEPWHEALTEQQRKILNAACGDLSAQISWHGFRLSKDDWRHMIAGTILGWRMMPAIDRGEGAAGERGRRGRGMICTLCGRRGHLAKDCKWGRA